MPADPLPHDAARVALAALLTDTRAARGYVYLTASTAPAPEMPVLEVGDVVWIKADAAKYTVLSDLHGRWLSEDVDEIFRDGVTIWRKGATINDPR